MHLFIDTETTGLPCGRRQPRIVSIAWIVAREPTLPRLLRSMIIRPDGFLIPAEASAIHGITTAHARREGIALDVALRQLTLDVETHRPVRVVAHNLEFDRPVVDAEYQLLGLPSAFAGLDGACTLELSRSGWPAKRATLGRVHERLFGTPVEKAHDAGADVSACMRIFFALNGGGWRPPPTVTDSGGGTAWA
jgi:DNA polymerase-3 subunit alpha/DNA polymerase-3 subunit epsilon